MARSTGATQAGPSAGKKRKAGEDSQQAAGATTSPSKSVLKESKLSSSLNYNQEVDFPRGGAPPAATAAVSKKTQVAPSEDKGLFDVRDAARGSLSRIASSPRVEWSALILPRTRTGWTAKLKDSRKAEEACCSALDGQRRWRSESLEEAEGRESQGWRRYHRWLQCSNGLDQC